MVPPWSDDPETVAYLRAHPEIGQQMGVPPKQSPLRTLYPGDPGYDDTGPEVDEAGHPVPPPAPTPVRPRPPRPAGPAFSPAAPGMQAQPFQSLAPALARSEGMDTETPTPAPAGGSSSPAGMATSALLGAFGPSTRKYMQQRGMAPPDAELQGAQARAAVNKAVAQSMRGSAIAAEGIASRGHGRADTSAADAAEREADAPVQQLFQTRQAAAQGQATQREAAQRDPDSPESMRARDTLKALLPKVTQSIPGFDRMNVEQVKELTANGFKVEELQRKEAHDNDPGLKAIRERQLKLREGDQKIRGSHQGVQLRRLGIQEEKLGMAKGALAVPGMEFDNPVGHTAKEATTARTQVEMLDNFDRAMGHLQETFAKSGPQVGPTEAQRLMEQTSARLVPIISALEQAGQLTAEHQHLIESQLPKTNDLKAWMNPAAIKQVWNAVREDLHGGMASKAKGLGGHLKAPAPTAAPAAPAVVKYKRSPDGKHRVPVYADGTYGPVEAMP